MGGRIAKTDELILQAPDDLGSSPTGKCKCHRKHWHIGDSKTSKQPVSCLKCGAHWWMEDGKEVNGDPFAPFTLVRLPRHKPAKRPATRQKQRETTGPKQSEETVRVPIDLHDLVEDVGCLTLDPAATTRALVTLYQRTTGAPTGRLSVKEERQAMEEVVRQRAVFAPLADRLIKEIGQHVNDWIRGLLWMNWILSEMNPAERLAHLEALETETLRTRLGLPIIQEDLTHVKKAGTRNDPASVRRAPLPYAVMSMDSASTGVL